MSKRKHPPPAVELPAKKLPQELRALVDRTGVGGRYEKNPSRTPWNTADQVRTRRSFAKSVNNEEEVSNKNEKINEPADNSNSNTHLKIKVNNVN